MSDPLTALMHAVQVMNLLKTLIMRTLREREETVQEGYSTMSSRSSDRATDEEEYDSQQDMDTTSCESTGPASEGDDDDEQEDSHYNHSSDEKDEVESLSDIEERFLRQLDENENAKNDFRKQLQGILLCRENVSPTSASTTFNGDSCLSLSDSKIGSSCFTTTSDEEHSRTSSIVMGLSSTDAKEGVLAVSRSTTTDVEMVENMAESDLLPMQLCILK